MNNPSGLSLPGLLGVAFIVLKLMGYITWSWWWVLSPFWIPAAIAIVLVVGWVVIAMAISACVFVADRPRLR